MKIKRKKNYWNFNDLFTAAGSTNPVVANKMAEDVKKIASEKEDKKTPEKKENIFGSIITNLGGILSGAGDLSRGIKGIPNENITVNNDTGKNNTMLFVGIGAAVLVVIVVLVVMMKK